jgi:hypothetical protein
VFGFLVNRVCLLPHLSEDAGHERFFRFRFGFHLPLPAARAIVVGDLADAHGEVVRDDPQQFEPGHPQARCRALAWEAVSCVPLALLLFSACSARLIPAGSREHSSGATERSSAFDSPGLAGIQSLRSHGDLSCRFGAK